MIYKNLFWDGFEGLIDILTDKIKYSGKKYDYLIGINRGGLIGSVVLSHRLKIPHGVYTVQSYNGKEKKELKADLYISMIGFIKPHHNILIFDDINDSGESLKTTVERIKKIDSDIKNVDTAVLYDKDESIFKTTYFAEKIDKNTWVNFVWENKNSYVNIF